LRSPEPAAAPAAAGAREPAVEPLFLRACRGQSVERTPIWIMRQAGRYLPEYRALRARADFWTACTTPELACQITLQPVDRLGVDAAILFSDILVPLPGMGVPVTFDPGPQIDAPVRDRARIEALRTPDAREATPFVLEAVRLIRRELAGRVPLIGFAGAPFTMATYLVEGGTSKSQAAIRGLLFADPEAASLLLHKCARTIRSYLLEQIRAGAQAAMLFDTWAGILAPDDFARFALPHARAVFAELALQVPEVPRIYYAADCAGRLAQVGQLEATVVGVDWRTDLRLARLGLGPEMILQGNLDPAVLLAPPPRIEAKAREVLRAAGWLEEGGPSQRHVFNLGHGILPETPPEHALFLVETVRRLTSAAAR
jgi:uroporphyrinogen decarboxylase